MTRKTIAGLLWLAGCATAPDPAEAPRVITPLTLEPPPIYALLGSRQELSLESWQISALDSIAESVRDQNAPLADSLRSLGRDRSGRGLIELTDQTEPLLERIRANHRAAVERVAEVLTPEQEATTCRLFDQERSRRAEPRGGRRSPAAVRAAAADSASAGGGRIWTWCGAAPSPPG